MEAVRSKVETDLTRFMNASQSSCRVAPGFRWLTRTSTASKGFEVNEGQQPSMLMKAAGGVEIELASKFPPVVILRGLTQWLLSGGICS
jgi:hypothetical protein